MRGGNPAAIRPCYKRGMEESHWREQELSIELIDHHRSQLAAEARKVLAAQPGARLAGVVFAPDAAEAVELRAMQADGGVSYPENAAIPLLCDRAFALDLLRAATPAQLDWLASEPDRLPIVCVTRHGTRLGWASLREGGDEAHEAEE